MKAIYKVIVRFYGNDDSRIRTDVFSCPSNAGLWLRLNGYLTKVVATEWRYSSADGYALVEYVQ